MPSILLVHQNPDELFVYGQLLQAVIDASESVGRVYQVQGTNAALRIFSQHHRYISLAVISSELEDDVACFDLLERLRRIRADLKTILLTPREELRTRAREAKFDEFYLITHSQQWLSHRAATLMGGTDF